MHTDEELISGYLSNYKTKDESYLWALDEVIDITYTDPERLWTITLEMINRSEDDTILAYIAAGPLEDLLNKYGDTFIVRIEEHARKNPKFRLTLTGVWGMKPIINERVQKACGKGRRL